MTTADLTSQTDNTEVKKGFSFYKSGCLEPLSQNNTGTWQTTVRGSGYEVEVDIKENIIHSSACSCPEKSPFCKHIIATLFTIRYGSFNAALPEIKSMLNAMNVKVTQPTTKAVKETFLALVEKIPENEIRKFIIDYAAGDKQFKNEFHACFSQKSILQGQDDYAVIVTRVINSTDSFRYKDIRKSLKAVDTLLQKGKEAFDAKEYLTTANIAMAVIDKLQDEVIILKGDSRGGFGECIDSAFGLLKKLAKTEISRELKDSLLKSAVAQLSTGKYYGYWNEGHWKELLTTLSPGGTVS